MSTATFTSDNFCLLVVMSARLPFYLFACLSALPTCLFVSLLTCQSVYLLAYLSICLPAFLSACLPVYLSVCQSVSPPACFYLSVCVHVCLVLFCLVTESDIVSPPCMRLLFMSTCLLVCFNLPLVLCVHCFGSVLAC